MRDEKLGRVQYDMSLKGVLLLYGTAELAALTVNTNTVKTGTDLQIGLMETTQPMDFSLLKEKPSKMEVTS